MFNGEKISNETKAKWYGTRPELTAAAHQQCLASPEEVARATLDPRGTTCIVAKTPPPEEHRHREPLKRLDQLGGNRATEAGAGSASVVTFLEPNHTRRKRSSS